MVRRNPHVVYPFKKQNGRDSREILRLDATDIGNAKYLNRVAGFLDEVPYAWPPLCRYQKWLRGDGYKVGGHYTQVFHEEEIER